MTYVSLKPFLNIISKVSSEVHLTNFEIRLSDWITLIESCSEKSKLTLTKCNILIPRNFEAAKNIEEKKYLKQITNCNLKFMCVQPSTLKYMSFVRVKFSKKAFKNLVDALSKTPLWDSLEEIHFNKIDITKTDILEYLGPVQFKVTIE